MLRTCAMLACVLLPTACGCQTGETEKVTIGGQEFELEVVTTEEAIQRGLGGRTSIPHDGGMLFVFPNAQVRRFWMKDCLIDMDIMFLSALGRITAIHEMTAEPPRDENETEEAYELRLKGYTSLVTAQYAIELEHGRIAALGLKQGQKVAIPIECLKKRLP
jgi:hypothetical protein